MANVVITGATSGIGRALAQEFAKSGHSIIGCGRNTQKLEALSQELGDKHLFSKVDVSNPEEVDAWAKLAMKQFDKIDYLINNAGVVNEIKPLWEISAADFANVININVIGTANTIRSFVPNMVKLNHGTIINFCSDWGTVGERYYAPYCASKFAVDGLNQSLAQELPSQMITVALSPYLVFTEMAAQLELTEDDKNSGTTPESWARSAAELIIKLTKEDNGKLLRL